MDTEINNNVLLAILSIKRPENSTSGASQKTASDKIVEARSTSNPLSVNIDGIKVLDMFVTP